MHEQDLRRLLWQRRWGAWHLPSSHPTATLRKVSSVKLTQFPWPSYPGQPGEDISYPGNEPSDQIFSKTSQPIIETPPIPITASKIEIHLSHMPKNICFIQPTHSLKHPSRQRQTMGKIHEEKWWYMSTTWSNTVHCDLLASSIAPTIFCYKAIWEMMKMMLATLAWHGTT